MHKDQTHAMLPSFSPGAGSLALNTPASTTSTASSCCVCPSVSSMSDKSAHSLAIRAVRRQHRQRVRPCVYRGLGANGRELAPTDVQEFDYPRYQTVLKV